MVRYGDEMSAHRVWELLGEPRYDTGIIPTFALNPLSNATKKASVNMLRRLAHRHTTKRLFFRALNGRFSRPVGTTAGYSRHTSRTKGIPRDAVVCHPNGILADLEQINRAATVADAAITDFPRDGFGGLKCAPDSIGVLAQLAGTITDFCALAGRHRLPAR